MPSAVLRFLGVELPFFYLMLFVFLLISLVFSSELNANFGLVSKGDLIKVIENNYTVTQKCSHAI